MGPSRKRELAGALIAAAVVGFALTVGLYPRWFPPITLWTGISLLGLAVAEALWARVVRAKIGRGEIGDGTGLLHPLAVARTVTIAKASAWVGAIVAGWWIGMLAYLLPMRASLEAAAQDTAGAVVAAASALALTVAGLWLQHCCRKPDEPPDDPDAAPE